MSAIRKEKINVLSLFDGMSCGQIALNKVGIEYENYFASEIDKHAIKVTQHNYPDTIQLGDLTKVKVKLLCLSEVYSYICSYDSNLQSNISEWEVLYWLNKDFTLSAKIRTQKPNERQEVSEPSTLQRIKEVWFSNREMGSVKKFGDYTRSRRDGEENDIRTPQQLQRGKWWYDNDIYRRYKGENIEITIGKTKNGYSEKKNFGNIEGEVFKRRESESCFRENEKSNVEKRCSGELFERKREDRFSREVDKEKGNRRTKEGNFIDEVIRELCIWDESDGITQDYWGLLRLHKEEQITVVEYDEGLYMFKGSIDLCIGGSPCQGFSFAGKQLNFEDPRSKLFFEFVRLLEEIKPKYFLLENVKMKKEHEQVITEYLGVLPILINSALLTAHNRPRLYWTNIPNISQPSDKGVYFEQIRDLQIENYEYIPDEKTINREYKKNYLQYDINGKGHGSQDQRAYYLKGKHGCLDTGASGKAKVLENDGRVRKITRNEAERLQGIPDNYTTPVSKAQALKMLGNGWTVDVIAHIFSSLNEL